MILVYYYIIIAMSFSISSYYFIHKPAIKDKNTFLITVIYLVLSFIYFPKLLKNWLLDAETLKQGLYNERISS